MRLHKQLILLSLFTLSLPWVGCQYIKEMNSSLKQNQESALVARAQAITASLGSNAKVIEKLKQLTASDDTPVFYAHSLSSLPLIDGYKDDWKSFGYKAFPLPLIDLREYNPNLNQRTIRYIAGTDNKKLFLFIQIEDPSIEYYAPSKNLNNSDHLVVSLSSSAKEDQYIVLASAPGPTNVRTLDSLNNIQNKFALGTQAVWRESNLGYDIELMLPIKTDTQAVSIKVFNASDALQSIDERSQVTELLPIVSQSPQLTNELKIFRQQGIKLQIATLQNALAASTGDISSPDQTALFQLFQKRLSSFFVGRKPISTLNEPEKDGFFQSKEVSQALSGEPSVSWYSKNNLEFARAAYPISMLDDESPLAALVIEQNSNNLSVTTQYAFNRLILYSVLVMLGAAFCLVIYATWLSLRIKKLSKAATQAISDSGKITENFPTFKSKDEIGELSRNYAQLLARLKEYTNYLKTLSSKLSHELRTPLAIVRSSLDNLEHESLPDQARTYADRAKEGTTRLSNILNAMSAASRVEQAISSAELEKIPCDELLLNLKEAYKDVYSDVTFGLNIQPSSKGFSLLASGELLVQLLDKLVDNAADFCPPKGLIELGLYRTDTHIVITVRNEGPPLPSHMQSQLFDSMVSVRDKGDPSEEGHHLGLGLYIVRLIADFHQGEVQGYNIPDLSGVIFEIRLPI